MHMDRETILARKDDFYLKASPTFMKMLYGLLGVGIVGFGLGLAFDPVRTWGSFLFNLLFFFAFGLAGVAFSNMQAIIGALWGRTLHRLHESFGSFVPVAAFFLFVFLTCVYLDVFQAKSVYSWAKHPEIIEHFPGKDVWLQYGFMYLRDIFALGLITALVIWHLKMTTSRDRAYIEGRKEESAKLAKKVAEKMKFWSGGVLVVYALAFTLLAFDLTMSLAPTWFSTLWGGWMFAIMMQTTMAFLLLWMYYLKRTPMGQLLQRSQFHDVGKFIFGLTIFFAYLSYAHVLTYWYANMPEETSYFITRLKSPWLGMVISLPFVCWLIPMLALVPKVSKWDGRIAIPVCILILCAQWMMYMLVVIPELVPGKWNYPLTIELSLFAFFFSIFMLTVLRFNRDLPLVAIGDPLLLKSFEHH